MSRTKSVMEDIIDFIERGYTTEQIIKNTGYEQHFIEELRDKIKNEN